MSAKVIRSLLYSSPIAKELWDASREGMAYVSKDGKMQLVNPAFASMLGYAPNELEGIPFVDITVGSDIQADSKEFGRLVRGETPGYSMNKTYRHKLGHHVGAKLLVRRSSVEIESVEVLFLGMIELVETIEAAAMTYQERRTMLAEAIGDVLGRYISQNPKTVVGFFLVMAGVINLKTLVAWVAGVGG